MVQLIKQAPEKTKLFSTIIVPLSYFASRDSNNEIKSDWKLIWEESSLGSNVNSVKYYADEIVEVTSLVLEKTSSWVIRKQCGVCFTDLVGVVGDGFIKYSGRVVLILVDSLAGRTWDNKEFLLEALVDVCIASKSWIKSVENSLILEKVVEVFLYNLDCFKRNEQEQ